MPPGLAFENRRALPLEGPSEDHRGTPLGPASRLERIQQGVEIVTVHDDGVPAKRGPAALELLEGMPPLRRPALSQRVDVCDAAHVVELVMLRHLRGLPDRSFSRLAIAQQHVGPVVGFEAPRIQRDAHRRADALSERPGRHVDERQSRRGMALEIGIETPELHQFVGIDRPGLRPRGIQQRCRVPLRQDETVTVWILRVRRIEPHLREEQRRHDVRGGTTARGMSSASFGRRSNRIDTQTRGGIPQGRDERCSIGRHDVTSEARSLP